MNMQEAFATAGQDSKMLGFINEVMTALVSIVRENNYQGLSVKLRHDHQSFANGPVRLVLEESQGNGASHQSHSNAEGLRVTYSIDIDQSDATGNIQCTRDVRESRKTTECQSMKLSQDKFLDLVGEDSGVILDRARRLKDRKGVTFFPYGVRP